MSEGTCTCKLQADECDGKHGTFHPFQVGANCTVRACEKTLAHSPIDWQRECDRLRVSLVDADKLIGDLIKERDHRDEIIDKLCGEVLGPDRPEWSSAYGFDDAVSDVEERMAALEQPAQQEPVYAFRRKGQESFCTCDKRRYDELWDKPNLFEVAIFYTTPPAPAPAPDPDELTIAYLNGIDTGKKRKPWVGLTDEQIQEVRENCGITHHAIKTIEAKLKEKNT